MDWINFESLNLWAAKNQRPWILGTSIEATAEFWAKALRDAKARIRPDYVVEAFADDDAVLVIDETDFLKPGKASRGDGWPYTGSAGKITNGQIGVFAAYVSGVDLPVPPLGVMKMMTPNIGSLS